MGPLIDMLLIITAVGISIGAVVKYFLDLGQPVEKKSQPIACAGCNSSCHTAGRNPTGILSNHKIKVS